MHVSDKMGIHCEIKISKPAEGAFRPGSIVAGVIRYTLSQEMVFKKITISLKGHGYLIVKRKQREHNLCTRRKSEAYVDTDYVIYVNENEEALTTGSYETWFSFTLPDETPPSLKYTRTTTKYLIQCYILYCIRIKFESPGLIKATKKFKKEIPVISVVTAALPIQPTIYGERKDITKLLSKEKGIVDMRATVEKSVTVTGEKLKIDCEVKNSTNVIINGVVTKIVEVYTFVAKENNEVTIAEDVKDTALKSGIIDIGETQNVDVEILVPSNISTVGRSRLVSRNYYLAVIAELPKKRCAILKIPIQIGDEIQNEAQPPTYWDVIAEDEEYARRRRLSIFDFNNMEETTEL